MPDGDHALLSKIAPRVDWRIPSPTSTTVSSVDS